MHTLGLVWIRGRFSYPFANWFIGCKYSDYFPNREILGEKNIKTAAESDCENRIAAIF